MGFKIAGSLQIQRLGGQGLRMWILKSGFIQFRRRFAGVLMKVYDDQDYDDGAIWCSGGREIMLSCIS